jgi:hypothetical protein
MGKFTSLAFCFCEPYVIFMLFLLYIIFFLYTRVFDGYVFVACRCGTSATCELCL